MKIKRFPDTDTAHVELSEREVAETQEISDNVYVDLDHERDLVSMTIEHAQDTANIRERHF